MVGMQPPPAAAMCSQKDVDVMVAEKLAGVDAGWQPIGLKAAPLPLTHLYEASEADPPTVHRAAAVALRDVLRVWRATARRLDGLDPSSPYRATLEGEVAILRSTHHRLFEAVRRQADTR